MTKVTIIGTGSVGSTIAYTMAVQGIASEIVMIDINNTKASGEAMDINQGTAFMSPVKVYAGTYRDAVASDIVIITSGIARKPGQTRLDLTRTNVEILKTISAQITKYAPGAIYIIVSNPVDILTYVFNKISGIPENRIIGSGTILDTARLRSRIADYYNINKQNIHACVYGEHGDSSFVPWSMCSISNIEIDKYYDCLELNKDTPIPRLDYNEVENYIKKSGGEVISKKGATFYAVSISVCHIVKCIFSEADTSMTVSSMMHGEYGIEDVALSTLTIVGKNGIIGKIKTPLTDVEQEKLRYSAACLRQIIDQIEV